MNRNSLITGTGNKSKIFFFCISFLSHRFLSLFHLLTQKERKKKSHILCFVCCYPFSVCVYVSGRFHEEWRRVCIRLFTYECENIYNRFFLIFFFTKNKEPFLSITTVTHTHIHTNPKFINSIRNPNEYCGFEGRMNQNARIFPFSCPFYEWNMRKTYSIPPS